jgi:uncharacterized membrane protein YfhO
MKNILGTTEKLELKDENGVVRYAYFGFAQYTYNSNGNLLKFEDSDGYWCKSTYDSSGNELTYENSDGTKRSFDIKEYTMEELTKKLGHNFKIKK